MGSLWITLVEGEDHMTGLGVAPRLPAAAGLAGQVGQELTGQLHLATRQGDRGWVLGLELRVKLQSDLLAARTGSDTWSHACFHDGSSLSVSRRARRSCCA